jgi:hypothetical protein
VAEIEADEVGASLKFATAKVERATERAPSDRTQGRGAAGRAKRRLQRCSPVLELSSTAAPPVGRGRRAVDGREMADASAP